MFKHLKKNYLIDLIETFFKSKKKIINRIQKLYYICLSALYEYKIIIINIKIAYTYTQNDFY